MIIRSSSQSAMARNGALVGGVSGFADPQLGQRRGSEIIGARHGHDECQPQQRGAEDFRLFLLNHHHLTLAAFPHSAQHPGHKENREQYTSRKVARTMASA